MASPKNQVSVTSHNTKKKNKCTKENRKNLPQTISDDNDNISKYQFKFKFKQNELKKCVYRHSPVGGKQKSITKKSATAKLTIKMFVTVRIL